MKQIQVEAITTVVVETIKPSTPTPHHLRRHNLSLIDTIMPQEYINTIVYFLSNPSTTRPHVSNTLKTSLAEILTIYYPLAGRIVDNNLYVDCYDQGVEYREVNVKGSLNDKIISELDTSEVSKFLSGDHKDMVAVGPVPLLVVQVNFFECGGFVIGLLMSHVVSDAQLMFTFLKNWASVARNVDKKGVYNFILPEFGAAAKLFPPVDLTELTPAVKQIEEEEEEERVSRRFVFSNDTILGLCKKYSSTCDITKHEKDFRRPSRVEALSAFLWKRYIASTQTIKPGRTYGVVQVVNLRRRFDPPLPPSFFGSAADMAIAIDTSPDKDDHHKLVKTIRKSISNLSDPKNTELYKNGVQFVPVLKEKYEWMNSENAVWVLFSSFCRLYEFGDADFGWGPPPAMHMYIPITCSTNSVAFMDANDAKGIEVWVSFKKEDMDKFEVDTELLAHASRPAA